MRTIVLAEFPMIDYVLLARVNDKDEVYEFVCAYHYDKSDKTWGQGHYFQTLVTAYCYIQAVLNLNPEE